MSGVGTATLDFGGLAVPKDATKGWYFPTTLAQWRALVRKSSVKSIVPTHIHPCQDVSGDLVDALGVTNAVHAGSAATYGVVVPGFTRLGVRDAAPSTSQFVVAGGPSLLTNAAMLVQVWSLDSNPGSPDAAFHHFGTVGTYGATLNPGTTQGRLGAVGRSTAGIDTVDMPSTSFVLVSRHDFPVTLPNNVGRLRVFTNKTYRPDRSGRLVNPGAMLDVSGTVTSVNIQGGAALNNNSTMLWSALFYGTNAKISDEQVLDLIDRITRGPLEPVPGTNQARVTVTGQAGITSTSHVEAWIQGNDATADHNEYEHSMVPMTVRIDNIANGVGFDIVATSDLRLSGTFKVHWVWN